MKIWLVVVLALLLAVSLTKKNRDWRDEERPRITETEDSFSGTFAATWLGGFCYENKPTKTPLCDYLHYNMWDRQSFTIHGYWPSSKTSRSYSDFSLKNFDAKSALLRSMNDYWPAQSNARKPEGWLWNHEYNKHGKDHSNIIQYFKPDQYRKASSEVLQRAYFTAGVSFYNKTTHTLKKINLTLASEPVEKDYDGDVDLSKSQLAEIIGLDTSTFLVSCKKDSQTQSYYLTEIQICFRIHRTLEETYESCAQIKANGESPSYDLTDTCPNKFKLIDYEIREPVQPEVTKYPTKRTFNDDL